MTGTPNWSDLVFQVSGAGVQQRILRALRQIDRPGVMALGAHCENQYFIILDCQQLADEVHGQHIVMVFDRHAVRTYSSRERLSPVRGDGARASVTPIRSPEHS